MIETPVETPLLLERTDVHQPTCAPEFEPDLPRSTFAPPPVDIAVLDYDDMMAEILRLEVRIQELRMQVTGPCHAGASREGGA